MSKIDRSHGPVVTKTAEGEGEWKRTPWGEALLPIVSAAASDGLFSLFDFCAPAGFGPPKHYHVDDVEVITVTAGRLAVWTQHGGFAAEVGDVIHIPKQVEHSWRAVGTEPVRLRVLMTPGKFEAFFDMAARRGLVLEDGPAMMAAAADVGIVVTGAPLTADEADDLLAGSRGI